MHRFIKTQSFDVRPVEDASALIWHPVRIEQSLESHVTRGGRWFDLLQQFLQRKTDPGDYHRPTFNASQPVDPLFKWKLQQLVEIKNSRFVYQTFYTHRPRLAHKTFCGISDTTLRDRKRRVGKECRSRWSPY